MKPHAQQKYTDVMELQGMHTIGLKVFIQVSFHFM